MPDEHAQKTPPLRAEVGIGDFAGESDVTFEAAVKSSSSKMTEVVQIAQAFAAAAGTGMFSQGLAANTRPIETAAMEGPAMGNFRCQWKVRGIQAGAYRVLLNMLDVMHHFSDPLESIRISTPSRLDKQLNWKEVMNAPFPGIIINPPFKLQLKPNLANSRDPLIRLEFQREVKDEELARLVPLFIAWDNIIIRGGYLEDLGDRDADINIEESLASQQTYLASPTTVEHLFYEFIGAKAAFDALINIAINLHVAFRPLTSFGIE
jgi:hypothetical protein